MNNFITSQIRTYTPMVVGALLAWLTSLGFTLDDGFATALAVVLTTLFSGLYYFVARLLEREWPQLGWLLGSPQQPVYKTPTVTNKKTLE